MYIKDWKDYQTTLNTQVKNMVDSINKLGDKIYTLNKKISKIESTGIEDANDLRDERDAAIDELSKYIDITYYENDSKEVVISAGRNSIYNNGRTCEDGYKSC